MEGVGGAAAVAQLIGLCAKCIRTTTQVVESYQDAPIQIHQLATKIDWLHFCIGQIRDIGDGLPDDDFDKLLPAQHRAMLLVLLQRHHDQLLNIESIGSGTKCGGKRPRLRWALLDKRKTAGIMQGLEEIQQMLVPTLSIMNFRLTTLNHTSLSLLSLSHSALIPAFETRTQEIMDSLRSFSDKQEELVQALSLQKPPRVSNPSRVSTRISLHPDDDPDSEERVDELLCLGDLGTNETLYCSSWSFGGHPDAQVKRLGVEFSAQLTQNYSKARVSLRLPFYFLGDRILKFELGVRQFTKAWTSISFTNCQMRVVNVRPANSQIFQLCRESDFDGVKSMIEEGRASVSDVDNLNHAGLLEYALMSAKDAFAFSHQEREKPMLKLVNYLLQQGCNSAAFVSSTTLLEEYSTEYPVIIQALFEGYPKVLRLLVQNGFSFETEEDPASRIFAASASGFREQLDILFSLGFMSPGSSSYTEMLLLAVTNHCIPEIIYAFEKLKASIDPKSLRFLNPGYGMSQISFAGAKVGAILQQYGLVSSFHTDFPSEFAKLVQSYPYMAYMMRNHWILLLDQSCSLAQTFTDPDSSHTHSPWSDFWWKSLRPIRWMGTGWEHCGSSWNFDLMVTMIEQFAHHGAPVATPLSEPFPWSIDFAGRQNSQMQLKSEDMARSWSYLPDDDSVYDSHEINLTYELEAFIERDDRRLPGVLIRVYKNGWIEKTSETDGTSDGSEFQVDTDDSIGEEDDDTIEEDDDTIEEDDDTIEEDGDTIEEDGDTIEEDDDTIEEAKDSKRPGSFASVVSTREGRRHLFRFPLVKALCCALQRVGYRVDMDDEGDLWYEDEDGDLYFDAVENLRDLDHEPGPLGGTCRICRNPREYGLGHMVDEMEDGLEEWRHERQKFVKRGVLQEDNFVWPSWTRRGGYDGV